MKKFVGGMAKDTSRQDQPEGTYRDALNTIVNLETGTINNEFGASATGGANIEVLGVIPINKDRVIFLGLDNDEVPTIALIDPADQSSQILYKDANLNFKRSHPITGEYRQDAKNDVIIYFTDNYYEIDEDITEATYVSKYNPPRTFNITRQQQALAFEESQGFTPNYFVLYGEINYDVEKLTLFPDVGTHSRIKNGYVYEGGAVVAATYHLALAYADEDFIETNYFVVSNPLYIVPEPDSTIPADIVIGAQKGTVTTKSCHWKVHVPKNVNYKYLQPAVIQRIGNAENVYKLDRVQIQYSGRKDVGQFPTLPDLPGNYNPKLNAFPPLLNDFFEGRATRTDERSGGDPAMDRQADQLRSGGDQESFLFTIVYSGREDVSTLSPLDIVADKIKYLTARALTQVNDTLYLGNLISRKDIGFQRYSTNIKVSPTVKSVGGFDRRVYDIITLNKGYGTMVMPYSAVSNNPRGFDGVGQTYFQVEQNGLPIEDYEGGNAIDKMHPDYISAVARFLRYPSTNFLGEDADGEEVLFGTRLRIGGQKTGVSYDMADATRRGYKDNRFTYSGKSFRRGDVYAFFISFVLRDGTETYAYHIPGRPALPLPWNPEHGNVLSNGPVTTASYEGSGDGTNYTVEDKQNFLLGDLVIPAMGDETDLGYLREDDKFTYGSGAIQWKSHGFHSPEVQDIDKTAKIYQFVDTSYNVTLQQEPAADSEGYAALRNNMGFWENENEKYPYSEDWIHTGVNGTTGLPEEQDVFGDTFEGKYYNLQGRRVRHHRMPSNYNREFSYVQYSTASINPPSTGAPGYENSVGSLSFDRNYGALYWENTSTLARGFMVGYEPEGEEPQSTDVLQGAPWITSHRDKTIEGTGFIKKRLITNETARILGIELKDIKIPMHMLKEIQGYKIYYAKRGNSDKLIAGQSLSIPCMPRYATSPNQNRLLARKGPYFNAFYAYGGLRSDMQTAMGVASKWKGAYQSAVVQAGRDLGTYYTGPTPVDDMFRYYGNPVFTFHDFNMLRKRPSLNTVTHVQCQAAIAFRHYQGGPGVFSTRKEDSENNEKLSTFPSLGWISQGLGNMVDYNVDGEIYDISDVFIDQDEDVNNPYGNDNPPADEEDKPGGFLKRAFRRLRGKEKDVDDVEDYSDVSELRARRYRIRSWRGGAYIACAHYMPEDIYKHREIVTGGDHRKEGTEEANPWAWNGFTNPAGFDFVTAPILPRNSQFTFVLDPGSKTYLPGQRNLKTAESSSFKGAQYIFNRGGESSIVLALASGLPHLKGLVPWKNVPGEYNPWYESDVLNPGGLAKGGPYNIAAWGDENKFLFPDAWFQTSTDPKPENPIPDYFALNPDNADGLTTENSKYKGNNFTLAGADALHGFPMAWLVNVCSAKRDVYTPFDKQTLVWTGHYRSLAEDYNDWELEIMDQDPNGDMYEGWVYDKLEAGIVPIYSHSGTSAGAGSEESPACAYFKGASSEQIFGGDTYITKYSFRTTSHSYGHSWFRASKSLGDTGPSIDGNSTSNQLQKVIADGEGLENSKNTRQKDVPDFLSISDYGTNWGTAAGMTVWNPNAGYLQTDVDLPLSAAEIGKVETFISNTLLNAQNWQQGNSNPVTSLFSFMVESPDNIGLRHQKDSEAGVATKFFDFNTAAEVLFSPPTQDFTKGDNLLYEDHLNFLQDKKVAIPFPKARAGVEENDQFRTRIIRSKKATGSLSDRYREFLANDFADVPKNRGEITDLFTIGDTLYVHTEKALFQTKGNEQLELGNVKAFIGSGDIFAIAPTELQNSEIGYGGTTSSLSSVTTEFGHFYVARRNRKIHMVGQGIEEIMTNMYNWFRDNMPYAIEQYGINVDADNFPYNPDSVVHNNVAMGFHVGYDPKFKRILLTKKERVPNQTLLDEIAAGTVIIQDNVFYKLAEIDPTVPKRRNAGEVATFRKDVLDKFLVNTSRDKLGPSDQARLLVSDLNNSANKDIVVSGPIGLANDNYFKDGGWTLSYLPELKMWVSRHSYMPSLYVNGEEFLYSINSRTMYKHNDSDNPGRFYGIDYNFEFEYIDNTSPADVKLFSNVYYWAEAKKQDEINITEFKKQTFPIFDTFYVYNSNQISGESTQISYLNNCRLVDKVWYLNSFRDMASIVTNTNDYINTGLPNIVGDLTQSIQSPREDTSMFLEEGVPNPDFVDSEKLWHRQKKMVGHYMGVRLISNNKSKNLIHLYAAGTKHRKSYR